MRLNKLGFAALSLLTAGTALGTLYFAQTATAAISFGRADDVGYYDGVQYSQGNHRFFFLDGIPTNYQTVSTTAQNFTDGIWTYLTNAGTPDQIAEQDAARASVLINTMMGVQATDPRYTANPAQQPWQNGIDLAKTLFPDWKKLVIAYDTPNNPYGGSVNFNLVENSVDGEINGSGVGQLMPIGWDGKSAPRGAAHGDLPDVVFAPLAAETQPAIRFTHADKTSFTIKKWCGNIIGTATPFPLNWEQKAALQPSTPPGSISGSAATVLDFSATAKNIGVNRSTGGILKINLQINGGPVQTLNQTVFGPLDPNVSTSPPLTLRYPVPAFTPAGTTFCFYASVAPHLPGGGEDDSIRQCYPVGYASSPGIQGLNGDVHAGGGVCGSGQFTSGNVTGNPSSVSLGDYVVASGGGVIFNFKSNGGINNDLSASGYARACRPDLLQAANNGRVATDVSHTNPTVLLDDITLAGMPNVYYFDGAVLHISGTIHSKLTIVATIGSIVIDGPVLLDNSPVASRFAPSLGIIAAGNITIDPLVTRVDGYLFSNGTIDTCDPGATRGSTDCTTPQLLVNGFLMAKNISFNRVGRANTGGAQVSERIVLTPQLYLNPPRFFDDGTTTVLQSQGEKPPLY